MRMALMRREVGVGVRNQPPIRGDVRVHEHRVRKHEVNKHAQHQAAYYAVEPVSHDAGVLVVLIDQVYYNLHHCVLFFGAAFRVLELTR